MIDNEIETRINELKSDAQRKLEALESSLKTSLIGKFHGTRIGALFAKFPIFAPIVTGAILLILALCLIGGVDWLNDRSYEKKQATLTAERDKLKASSAQYQSLAEEAIANATAKDIVIQENAIKIAALEKENARLAVKSQEAKLIYVEAKENPKGYIPLTNDSSVDRRNLCAELAKHGFACTE